jgi:hypothetical protein
MEQGNLLQSGTRELKSLLSFRGRQNDGIMTKKSGAVSSRSAESAEKVRRVISSRLVPSDGRCIIQGWGVGQETIGDSRDCITIYGPRHSNNKYAV